MFHAGDEFPLEGWVKSHEQGAVPRHPHDQVRVFLGVGDGIFQHFRGNGIELHMPAFQVKKTAQQGNSNLLLKLIIRKKKKRGKLVTLSRIPIPFLKIHVI
jgi:hypothetical protein